MAQDLITVVKEVTFEAAHFLPNYQGPCGSLHGHTYRLQVGIKSSVDSETGMVIDFSRLKAELDREVLRHLDHSYLNEIIGIGFPKLMPTAENMVIWIRNVLLRFEPNICLIRLWETPTSFAEWQG